MGAMGHAMGRSAARPPAWAITALTLLAIAIAVLAVWRPWSAPPTTVAAGADEASVATPPEPLDLPDAATVLIFGDSWTWGEAAAPEEGYAYVVAELTGWTTVVDGVRGSGYLRPGKGGPAFPARIDALDPELDPDLVIVQGSINDRMLFPEGYREAVDDAWNSLRAVYPDTPIVVLGPAPHELPIHPGTLGIDATLATLATERGWWYISPIGENWITAADYLDIIDTSDRGRLHPSTEGHRYLAERLAAAIAAISR